MVKKTFLTKEKIIKIENGNVMHALKKNSKGYVDFGEAYFSKINFHSIKAWKKHERMTLNLLVPYGKVCFVVFFKNKNNNIFKKYILSSTDNNRLTIPPGTCFGFKGLNKPFSLVLNISDIIHDDKEVEKINLDAVDYSWRKII